MGEKGVIAFTEDGFILHRDDVYILHNLPRELNDRLCDKASDIYCAAFTSNEGYFCAWKEKDGGRYWWQSKLNNYPQLQEYLNNAERRREFELSTFHCSLGPGGSFYVNNQGTGQYYGSLDSKLEKELDRRVATKNGWQFDPCYVTLGVDGSYVLMGQKGDIFWDLKGRYGGLDKFLRESNVGVKAITLSPFNGSYCFVSFANETGNWYGCFNPDWNVNASMSKG